MSNFDAYETKTFAERVDGNPYVGRGIVIGMTPDGKNAVTAYFIMGRSENSRNRIFCWVDEGVMIKPFDESKVEDPSLIIYYPLRDLPSGDIIVTNGDQTDTIYEFVEKGSTFEEALRTREFEPDGPNWTPRISGIINFNDSPKGFTYKMAINKSGDPEGKSNLRFFYEYEPVEGVGHFLHTYMGDGSPLPTFTGEPERVVIPSDMSDFIQEIWNNLNEENLISLYVRYSNLDTGECEELLMNKHQQE